MPLYLCGQAALDVMRYLRSTNDGLIPGKAGRPRKLGWALHTNRQLNELGSDAERLLSHVRGKIQALVPTTDQVTRTTRLETHVWSHDIPRGAFINLGNGIFLSSPAFLFLQLATELDRVDLIRIGLELCGHYSRWRLPEPDLTTPAQDEFQDTTYELSAAITTSKLKAFIDRMKNERGAVNARQALPYVLDKSASPMESAVYLLLCLPRYLGGRGLPKPMFNVKVKVTTSTTNTHQYPDLYWPVQQVDVEYQSDKEHSGEWSRYRDSRREVELEAEKVTVLPLTRLQVMDAAEFNAFAITVRRTLGKRSRTLSDDWGFRYADLRRRLLYS